MQLLDQLWLLDLVKDSTSCLPNGLDQWAAQQWCSDAGDEAVPFGGSTAQVCIQEYICTQLLGARQHDGCPDAGGPDIAW